MQLVHNDFANNFCSFNDYTNGETLVLRVTGVNQSGPVPAPPPAGMLLLLLLD
jgi:hypothetical protein